MSSVVGPFSVEDWYLMKNLKAGIAYLINKDYNKYRIAIDKEKNILKDFFSRRAA